MGESSDKSIGTHGHLLYNAWCGGRAAQHPGWWRSLKATERARWERAAKSTAADERAQYDRLVFNLSEVMRTVDSGSDPSDEVLADVRTFVAFADQVREALGIEDDCQELDSTVTAVRQLVQSRAALAKDNGDLLTFVREVADALGFEGRSGTLDAKQVIARHRDRVLDARARRERVAEALGLDARVAGWPECGEEIQRLRLAERAGTPGGDLVQLADALKLPATTSSMSDCIEQAKQLGRRVEELAVVSVEVPVPQWERVYLHSLKTALAPYGQDAPTWDHAVQVVVGIVNGMIPLPDARHTLEALHAIVRVACPELSEVEVQGMNASQCCVRIDQARFTSDHTIDWLRYQNQKLEAQVDVTEATRRLAVAEQKLRDYEKYHCIQAVNAAEQES